MANITTQQRETLRRRLLTLSSSHGLISEKTIDSQIDRLLEEIFIEQPLPAINPIAVDESDEDRRVVVTGMGALTPLGIGNEPYWSGLVAGKSAVGRFTQCDASDFPCQVGGEVQGFDPADYMDAKEARRMSRSSQFAIAAAQLAVEDAHLDLSAFDPYDIGVLIASGATSFPEAEKAMQALLKGPMKISPFFVPAAVPNMPSCQVSIHFGLRGYTTTVCTACAAGSQAIGEAAEVIRRGEAEIMLAGGTEAPICRFSLGSFCAMRALSTHSNDHPEKASRPFDARRDGFVPSEAAAVLVLERLSTARKRGAHIYAELVGYASTCDAHHVTAPDPQGAGAARAMQRALFNAGITPQQVDYINAHATSTPVGDLAETLAIKQVFGEYAFSIPISSIKSMIGHTTAAAGAVEAVATILTLTHGVLPPTINQEYPDPECDLDYIPNVARPLPDIQIALSNSFGFGGVNAVLAFRQFNEFNEFNQGYGAM
ncbi:MAG: beta-ketoacyl-ACP synthase II [Chloroflexaceae bacterium]|nr:beta-ketoacyl-ACP synthase II [Chloroflexaceae bacterium]